MVFTMGFTIKVCSFEILVFGFGEGLWGWDLYVLGSWVSGSWRVGIREISYKVLVEDWNRGFVEYLGFVSEVWNGVFNGFEVWGFGRFFFGEFGVRII